MQLFGRIEDTLCASLMNDVIYSYISIREVFSDRREVKGKNTVLDDMMCIELMEIVARKIELMVPLSLLNLPPAVGGKGRGRGREEAGGNG